MLANPNPIFQGIINKLLVDKRYEQALKNGEQIYQIRQFRIENLTPLNVTALYYHITNKFYEKGKVCESESWYENQLRVFIWLLVGYSYIEKKEISNMEEKDWIIFSQIFENRNPDILQFQGMSIVKNAANKCRKWNQNQSTLLENIIKSKKTKNKWNQIARELFIISNKQYFRTAKQCRQHWINHLDPSPLRTNWTLEEDIKLIQTISLIGKKWSKISKKFSGSRTQHMVKNRYKSLLHFLKKSNKEISGQNCEKKLLQILKQELDNGMNNQFNLRSLSSPVDNINRNISFDQIQSAELIKPRIQPVYIFESNNVEEIENNDYNDSIIEEIEPLNFCTSPRNVKDDFSIFADYENNKSSFDECLNIFMAEDFKKMDFIG